MPFVSVAITLASTLDLSYASLTRATIACHSWTPCYDVTVIFSVYKFIKDQK